MSLCLQACLGYVTYTETEVSKEANNSFYIGRNMEQISTDMGRSPTKKETKGNQVTWLYFSNNDAKSVWCGHIPVVVIPIPLMLPVCEEKTEVIFEENSVTSYKNIKVKEGGFICNPLNILAPNWGSKEFLFCESL